MQNMFIIHDNKDFARGFLTRFAMLRDILWSFSGNGIPVRTSALNGRSSRGRKSWAQGARLYGWIRWRADTQDLRGRGLIFQKREQCYKIGDNLLLSVKGSDLCVFFISTRIMEGMLTGRRTAAETRIRAEKRVPEGRRAAGWTGSEGRSAGAAGPF